MSFPNGLTITNKGRILQAKAQTGVQLNFTKIQIGDGTLSGLPGDRTSLVSPKQTPSIISLITLAGGKAMLKTSFNNTGLETGYYFKEIGVFAQDPDVGEILYCYGNAGDAAEYIPADEGGAVLEKYLNLVTIVGNASNISATLDASLIYASQADLQDLQDQIDTLSSDMASQTDLLVISASVTTIDTKLTASQIEAELRSDSISGTYTEDTATDAEGRVTQTVHKLTSDGTIVRTDDYEYATTLNTETRTLSTGESIVFKDHLKATGEYDYSEDSGVIMP